MLFIQYIVGTLLASASMVLAIPTPDIIDLTVRSEDDYGAEYKRSVSDESLTANTKREPVETFVCKRANQSLSCLKRKDASADESLTANVKREPVETFVCKREKCVACVLRA
ncbi:hypothetical protein QBC34DRAFT_411792 [Podospora aff. communis PSN243]|uniref:Uncharacterized protein n=1 Tax=Podospora aff. communis PSN243 TaxID=3040156 RepID=A0AAV9GE87_9PEZI|nr:hypothetical protein QBC34DRAFT_411792 [Podospora aff. communis PSN243]